MKKKKIKKKILVVDDDREILDSLQIILEEEGYKVIPLLNPDRIYDRVVLHRPDLILLDVWFPHGIDGGEVASVLKSDKTTRNIPIILISAVSNIETLVKSSYADDFLAKPFEIDDVIEKVEKYT